MRVRAEYGVAIELTYTGAQGSREFVVFKPASLPSKAEERALVVMLHGCAQTADDMARGTRMNAAAEREGFIVLYPEQPASANPQKCWNWFVPAQSTRDQGEAALLAGLIDSVARAEGVSAHRVSIVGMSAGAAMAANLGVAYPERYAALAMHSGIPALAAKDVMGALAVMRQGASDGDALGAAALAAMGARARPIAGHRAARQRRQGRLAEQPSRARAPVDSRERGRAGRWGSRRRGDARRASATHGAVARRKERSLRRAGLMQRR